MKGREREKKKCERMFYSTNSHFGVFLAFVKMMRLILSEREKGRTSFSFCSFFKAGKNSVYDVVCPQATLW